MNGARHVKPGARFERIAILALCAAIGWFYWWTVDSNGDAWKFGREQNDYYNLLIDGYLDGHLHMKAEVPEALLKLKNPHDPRERPPGLGLHDASFYQGKYYVYFGAAPMVLVMLPFRLAAGVDLPLAAAVLLFVYLGFLVSVNIFLALRRRYFPAARSVAVLAGVAVLGVAALGPVLLRRPHMWELPIAAGYCFAMLALGCVWQSLHAARRRAWWLAGAGAYLGLAIASRPTYLLASPFLAVPLVWWWRKEGCVPWRLALSAALPLAMIGLMMAWHNYARFGDPLQFGQAYQFSFDYESKVTHFSAGYWGFNGWRYFFSFAEWSSYYPFIQPATLPPKPPGFSGHDDVYGVLVNLPVAWFALAAPLALWRRGAHERRVFGTWLAAVAVLFAIMAALMVSFFGSLGRYLFDFTPALMLLAGVGGLALERRFGATPTRGVGKVVRAAWSATAAFSVIFGVLYSLQFGGFLRERNAPKDFAVAKLLNHLPAWGERLAGAKHGPLDLTVQLPRGRAGSTETLLTMGAAVPTRLFLRYVDDAHVRVGFVSGPGREQWSRVLAADSVRPHRITLAAGALYPPESHPFFAERTAPEISQLLRRVRIELDGEPVIEGRFHIGGPAGRGLKTGTDVDVGPGEARFSGQVISAARREVSPAELADVATREHVRLRMRFAGGQVGGRETLLSFPAASGSGQVLYVRHLAGGQVRFGVESPGAPAGETKESEAVAARPGIAQEVNVSLGARPAKNGARELVVAINHEIVWTHDCDLRAGALLAATVGEARQFSGEIFLAERFSEGADPLVTKPGPLKLRLKFPEDRTGKREPLLVTGKTGAGNLLSVEYLDPGTVRFAFDFWGHATRFSEPVRIDHARAHELEIAWGGFEAVSGQTRRTAVPSAPLGVRVNGASVWEATVPFYVSEPEDMFVGREPLGATTCEAAFSGEIISATRGGP